MVQYASIASLIATLALACALAAQPVGAIYGQHDHNRDS